VPLASAHLLFWIGSLFWLRNRGEIETAAIGAALIWLGTLALWGLTVALWSLRGRFTRDRFLRWLPGIWFPTMAVNITLAGLFLSPALRAALSSVATLVPAEMFVLLQAARVLAIGTVIKALRGEIPRLLGLGVGGADTLYGVSALVMFASGAAISLGPEGLAAWNAVGAAILMSIPLLWQLTLPGSMQKLTGPPNGEPLFVFPLVMAPGLLATMFIIANVTHIVGLTLL